MFVMTDLVTTIESNCNEVNRSCLCFMDPVSAK